MATQAQMRELRDAVEAAIADREGAEGYRRLQRQALHGTRAAAGRAQPLEFDESGFPIIQQGPGLFERVRRLLGDR
jgi:hypothetical protein